MSTTARALALATPSGRGRVNNAIKSIALFGMKVDDETDIDNTEWWTANFYNDVRVCDATLLEKLYRRTLSKPQSIPDEVHPSVQDFLAAQNQKPDGVSVL